MTTPTPPATPAVPLNVQARIRFRRAWTQEWALANPVLRDGEPGYDKTLLLMKIGDGVTPWNDLPYMNDAPAKPGGEIITGDAAIDEVMASHINDPTPHPVYDDGPSLVLLYQNAKV